jgi:RNA polymerase sigma factor (sigma-70 family)
MKIQPPNSCNPEKWVEKYADNLFAWAYQRTGKRAIAEDLVRETFLSAMDDIKNLTADCNEKSWLYAILRDKIVGHFRQETLDLTAAEGHLAGEENYKAFKRLFFDDSGKWKKAQRPVNWFSEEENLPEDGEFMSILKMCLKLLPEKNRCIVTLRFMDERDISEICSELSISPPEFWAVLHQSKLQLRNCIEENWLND